jgi:hypothetical protein
MALAQRVPSLINSPGITQLAGVPVQPPFFNENKPLRNLPPVINDVVGAIEIQEAFENEEWVNEPVDPVAFAPFVRKNPLPGMPPKSLLIQFNKTDQTIPNPSTTAILRSGDLADVATYFRNDLAYAENPKVPKNPHNTFVFLQVPAVSAFAAAEQEQAAIFLASGGTQIIQPEPARFFEVPVQPPLPEGIEFIP